ncbi:amino acid adenylation domain-containing protein [Micromonospora sp. WMMD964]|uniref:amino acid adenylation domain-containing protein n=1 Tax=Micromonospora sp. WMMD964 TaxID=3016091 RepID=UPI00249A7226|nr:amino acid adenylation domain-containing protein [Micromonospora sp. WMMD964]WFE98627.1 amino acid adenylation domain-containing protein [Micromonospora sp. WMMD964]
MSLVSKILQACRDHAAQPAVIDGDEAHTYRDLEQMSARVAAGLQNMGCRVGDIVAVEMPRSFELYASILGVWRAACGANAIAPSGPPDRRRLVLTQSATRVVLVRPDDVPQSAPVADVRYLSTEDLQEGGHPPRDVDGANSYVVATSGSTGQPKCVVLGPAALDGLAVWHADTWKHEVAPRTLALASVGFDVCFQEMAATLTVGAALVVVDDQTRRDSFALLRLIEKHEVVRAFMTVASLQMLAIAADAVGGPPACLREIVPSGERLVLNDEVRELCAVHGIVLVNQYGPSETHVVTEYRLDGPPAGWPVYPPLGTAVGEADLLALDGDIVRPLHEGEETELVISGPMVGHGYRGDPELTSAKFREYQHEDGSRRRCYRSGDTVRLQDGLLHFTGRVDEQLKIRGYRVEPGEVEAVLLRVPGIRQVAVLGVRTHGTLGLVAVVTEKEPGAVTRSALAAALTDTLPDYMHPRRFLRLSELPMNTNGKVARRTLTELVESGGGSDVDA